jgi:hypothetical protein
LAEVRDEPRVAIVALRIPRLLTHDVPTRPPKKLYNGVNGLSGVSIRREAEIRLIRSIRR